MSGRRRNRWPIALSSLLVLVIVSFAPAKVAFATNLAPFIDLQERGLTLVNDGVGLAVNVGGPVRFALLYWAGSERPCLESSPGSGNCSFVQPFKDQQVIFDGTALTGTLIGTETQPVTPGGPTLHIGYFADVTSLVSAKGTGAQTFSFADGNAASNLWMLDGVSLLVAYTDAANQNWYRVLVWDGLDFAYGADATPGETRVTTPVTFNHGENDAARTAELYLIGGGGSASLLDEVTISNNPTQLNVFDSDDGSAWDDDVSTITIPAGVGTTTVQVVSPASAAPTGCGHGYWKNHPDAWAGTGYSPGQTVGSVFSGASAFPSLASQTLLQALDFPGGTGASGGARTLLRAAVAALLNAAHADLDYPRTTADVIADVNAALSSGKRATMLALAGALESDNDGGCFGMVAADALLWQVAALRIRLSDTGP